MLKNLEDLIEITPNDEKPSKANPSPAKFIINIDETKIDIYKQYDTNLIPEWQPTKKIKPISEAKMLHLDIETDLTIGIMPDKFKDDDGIPIPMWKVHRIVMIGIMNNEGKKIIIHDESEAKMLRIFFSILRREQPEILTTFNGFDFDLPYIIGRSLLLGIPQPFTIDERETCHRAAQRFSGHPSIYNAVRLKNPDGTQCAIIDLYHQLLVWDNVARKLDKYTLKSAPLQMGLRKEARLDLGAEGIKECIETKNWDTLKEYLIYDLEDTKDLADILLPSIYYQQLFIDWNLQSLATGGNGSKWNSILTDAYGLSKLDKRIPKSEEKHKYSGGYTDAVAGLYKNVFKIDVASLYPHIMIYYGIFDKDKDSQNKMLGILWYLLKERIKNKKLGKQGDKLAKQIEGSMKVLINSCFAGETLVTTKNGVFTIKELYESKVKHQVVDKNGDWSEVVFNEYGEQNIVNLTLTRGKNLVTIKTTENHRWLAAPYSRRTQGRKKKLVENIKYDNLLTRHLKKGMIIPHISANKPDTNNQEYLNGIAHGIIYGDGTFNNYKHCQNRYSINLANCKKELEVYFKKATNIRYISTIENKKCSDIYACISIENLSGIDLKSVPDSKKSGSYNLGFLRGLIATDGNVCKKDSMISISGELKTANWLEKNSEIIGYRVSSTALTKPKGTIVEFKDYTSKTTRDCYVIRMDLFDFEENDFLRNFHYNIFCERAENKSHSMNKNWIVKDIVYTHEKEKVYCCVEPNTSYFMLNKGIVTGNCYGATGTTGINFNSYKCAAMVTAIGRAIALKMVEKARELGCKVVQVDTDGVCISNTSEHTNSYVHKFIQDAMPEGINLDYEWYCESFYVPYNKCKSRKSTGLKKHYIMLNLHEQKGDDWILTKDIKVKGLSYTGRNRSKLDKIFQCNYLHKLHNLGKTEADKYYYTLRKDIMSGKMDINMLIQTKRLGGHEKTLPEQLGKPAGEIVNYYRGNDIPQYHKKTGKEIKGKICFTETGEYNKKYYAERLDEMYNDIFVECSEVDSLRESETAENN